MSWTKFTYFFAICALLAAPVMAAPTASLTGVANGSQFDWTLSFTLDDSLFSDFGTGEGVGDSLAASLQIETADGALVGGSFDVVDPDFLQTLSSVEITGVGFDAYNGGAVTDGVAEYFSVASSLDTGTKDALFVPLGSTFFNSAGPHTAFTFSTTSDTVWFGGAIAQDDETAGTDDVYPVATQMIMAGGGFSFADFNEDNFVDDLDLAAFFGQWGATDSFADFNEDNLVDDLDLAAFFGQWNPSSGALVASAVPEPSTFALVGLGLAGFGLAFRRK